MGTDYAPAPRKWAEYPEFLQRNNISERQYFYWQKKIRLTLMDNCQPKLLRIDMPKDYLKITASKIQESSWCAFGVQKLKFPLKK